MLATFLGLSLCLGGLAAFCTGRALAQNWRSFWRIPALVVLLAGFIHFLHYALFGEPLLSFTAFGADYLVTLFISAFGFFLTRKKQIRRQYGWLDSQP